jgi:hypothetical protein
LTAARSLVNQLTEPNNREKGEYFQHCIISDRQVLELYTSYESSASYIECKINIARSTFLVESEVKWCILCSKKKQAQYASMEVK